MNNAMVYVSSSDFEGMSNTMLEAMAMGVPTIATDCPIGGAKTVIKNGENGILTPVGNEKKIALNHSFIFTIDYAVVRVLRFKRTPI